MTEAKPSKICKNCASVQIENYCSNCGQKVYTNRFTVKSFFFVILDVFNIERGILHTFKMLFSKPGQVINEYISGKTKTYYNPLKYIILAAAINAFFILWLDILDQSMEVTNNLINSDAVKNNEEVLELQRKWVEFYKQFVNFIPLFIIPFASLASKWFFKSRGLLYGEHLIVNCFLFAQGFYLTFFLMILLIILPQLTIYFSIISAVSIIMYLSYSYYHSFQVKKTKAFLGALFTYILGLTMFMLFFMVILILAILIIVLLGYDVIGK